MAVQHEAGQQVSAGRSMLRRLVLLLALRGRLRWCTALPLLAWLEEAPSC